MYKFLAEMLEVLPCATYYKRQVYFCDNQLFSASLRLRPGDVFIRNTEDCQVNHTECLQGYALKKICEYASNRGFTDVVVFNEDRKSINGMLLVHLPGGPTAHFKLSNLRLSKDIKVSFFAHT